MIRFADIYLLYLLWLVPVIIGFYLFAFKRKNRALSVFGKLEMMKKLIENTSRKSQYWKAGILIFAFMLMVLALARPQLGTRFEEVKREGQDIIVVMDVSKSMLTEDITPNRLEKAKYEVRGIIERLQGDRIGLVIFAGESFVQCPLTLDYDAALMFLDIINVNLIPVPGTKIDKALTTAIGAFNEKERKHKVIILITDGEDHSGNALKVAEEATKEGIKVFTVGIGTPSGKPIPDINEGRVTGFKKDNEGNVIVSKLDEITLEKISLETDGKYYAASEKQGELDKIYDVISGMDKKEVGSMQFTQFEDRFQYILGFVCLLIIIEPFISDRRKNKAGKKS